MKRDLDLFRDILLMMESFEDTPNGGFTSETFASLAPKKIVGLHLALLVDCGFVVGYDTSTREGIDYALTRITNDGYTYLDSVRNPDTWNTIKKTLFETAGIVSVELVKDVASSFVKEKLFGLPPA